MAKSTAAWQENKTLLQRIRYVLDNEIATDVCFETCSKDGSVTLVRAHKLMLLTASPVFEAMFCGGMAEAQPDCGNIKITDIDAATFKEMLSYIYCETANITAATALPLMYAAKKYVLTGLVTECRETLMKKLGMGNVCTLLKHSISLDEYELRKKSLEFVSKHTCSVINTAAFMNLSRDAIDNVVGLDTLSVISERQLYEACVKWARHQLRQFGNEDPSDEDIRDTLGGVLYKIRFPTMTWKAFGEITAHSKILSAEEKLDVYVYMATGEKLESLKFLSHNRCRMDDSVISRFNNIHRPSQQVPYLPSWDCRGTPEAISIQTTVNIFLTGVGLFSGGEHSIHDVTLTVLKGSETLSTTVTKMTSDGGVTPVKILLEYPVHIHADTKYTVVAVIKGPHTWSGIFGNTTRDLCGGGKITFFNSAASKGGSDVSRGQIPQLFYCV